MDLFYTNQFIAMNNDGESAIKTFRFILHILYIFQCQLTKNYCICCEVAICSIIGFKSI